MSIARDPGDEALLRSFFAAPNELSWSALQDGSASPEHKRLVETMLAPLSASTPTVLTLPFVRNDRVTGWYATAINGAGDSDVLNTIRAWLGNTYLEGLEFNSADGNDPLARALRDRFGGSVCRFWGPDVDTIRDRLVQFQTLAASRPPDARRQRRPLGVVRAAFDRALLARDEASAQALLAELRAAGRLTQENLRFLDVRLQAGLGLWPQLAREHWTIKTLSELALPPQTTSDLIEALYRTFVDPVEARQDLSAVLDAFSVNALQYPRLFSSRHGVRTPRVLKAFMLHERLQAQPDRGLLLRLSALLPTEEQQNWLVRTLLAEPLTETAAPEVSADCAIEDGQYDRAFELLLAAAPSRSVFAKLLAAAVMIDDRETFTRLLAAVDGWPDAIVSTLASAQHARLEAIRISQARNSAIDSWQEWVDHLAQGGDPRLAALARSERAVTWAGDAVLSSKDAAQSFATVLGNLGGEAARVAIQSIPSLANAFLPDDAENRNAKPIAQTLLVLMAMEDGLSRPDLELISYFMQRLFDMGLSQAEYLSVVTDVSEVQSRVGSFAYLPWSIDLLEQLAVLPAASEAQREARLRLFMQVVGQVRSFAHRLGPQDWLSLEYLLPDFGLGAEALDGLRPHTESEAPEARPDLSGKTIGIYTLAETAGTRAKKVLETLFPGASVVVNSDLVCTAQLTALAEGADIFVFAWKSASHQALYCVKNATMKVEPAYPLGKGTASIVRAVLDQVG
jgi:hypothetical protein